MTTNLIEKIEFEDFGSYVRARFMNVFYFDIEKELFEKRGFVPTYLELKFGKPETSDLDYLKIEAPGGSILIEGQIDRVDISKEKSQALVIDYKRSAREFKVHEKLEKGLELQLPIYLLAVRRLLHLKVAKMSENRHLMLYWLRWMVSRPVLP